MKNIFSDDINGLACYLKLMPSLIIQYGIGVVLDSQQIIEIGLENYSNNLDACQAAFPMEQKEGLLVDVVAPNATDVLFQ